MPLTMAERQRRYRERRDAANALLPKVACACGCGTLIAPIGKLGKPVRYAHGHNPSGRLFEKGEPSWNTGKACPHFTWKRGTKLSAEEIAKRNATRLARNGGVYQNKRGWTHSEETRRRMAERNHMRGKTGPATPFFGRTHTEAARTRMGAAGPDHHNWRGGVATLPYGPEFTRKYKRLILERDGHRCRRCGKHQSELKHKLQVHHMDHDKKNNDPTNLAAACCGCNIWASYHRDEPFIAHASLTPNIPG